MPQKHSNIQDSNPQDSNYPLRSLRALREMSIDENMAPDSGIKVYPNPTYGPLYIQNLNFNNEIKSNSMLNTAGQKVEIFYPDSNNNTIFHNLSTYKPGLYIMHIDYSNRTEIRKIIKIL